MSRGTAGDERETETASEHFTKVAPPYYRKHVWEQEGLAVLLGLGKQQCEHIPALGMSRQGLQTCNSRTANMAEHTAEPSSHTFIFHEYGTWAKLVEWGCTGVGLV